MSDRLLKESDVLKIAFQLPYVVNSAFFDAVKALPSEDRPQGEWIDMGDFEKCSVCKGTHLKEFQSYYGKTTWVKTPYCPYCGADMRGNNDEQRHGDNTMLGVCGRVVDSCTAHRLQSGIQRWLRARRKRL